ncbi:MAG: prolyl-tRNA synthetase [Candidatus Staskawiczbacteria bacterium]|nr:prolyl-tRNA synthetase [Candidatus Staskawiczbacteria bacterium]
MLQSKLFYKTAKEKSADTESISHELLTRAGFVDQLMAGVYTFLPLGFMVLKKIENIIRKNMENAGGQEVLMPVLQPKENWQKTGRWETLDILFKIKASGEKEYALGPTHEEVISPLAKKIIFSYKDLPFYLFQIQTKFRNEPRAKSGILRTREFLMKDLYSFHADQGDLDKYYEKMLKVYFNIFKECGIYKGGKNPHTYRTLASGGSFSKYSDEFQTITEAGEDIIYICKKCQTAVNKEIISENKNCPNCKSADFEEKKAIEVGNIFKLGTKYSLPFDLKFRDKDGSEKPVLMGCYGIGISRLMGAVAEASHDNKGIIWPKNIAPFSAHLILVENSRKVKQAADKIYDNFQKQKIEILYDDRQGKSVGEKFAVSDLIGIPHRIVVSEKTLAKNSVEVKERTKNQAKLVKIKELIKLF